MEQEQFLREIIDLTLVMHRINRSIGKKMDDRDCPPLPPAQLYTLMHLARHQQMNMGQVAELLQMPRQQMTRVIDALVARGFVERTTDPSNRRYVIIALTAGGEEYIKDMILKHPGSMINRLLQELPEAETEKMLQAIIAIKEVLAKLQT